MKDEVKTVNDKEPITAAIFPDEIAKKINSGEKVTPEDIAAITKWPGSTDAMWILLLILLLCPFGWGGNSSADYWRGKYDAYKELHDKMEQNFRNEER